MQSDSANLDILRTLAVLFVVASHLPVTASLVGERAYHTQALGTLGVMIFFVHTCLVLMLSLGREARKNRTFPGTLPFFVRRIFRIYPLSISVVLTVAAIAWLLQVPPPLWMTSANAWVQFAAPDAWTVFANLLLIQNVTGHESVPRQLWSLPYEIQMYVFLPLLYLMVGRAGRRAALYIVMLWAGSGAVIIACWRLGWSYELIRFFPCFLPGVIAFALWNSSRKLPSWILFVYVVSIAIAYPWLMAKGVRDAMVSWPACLALGLLLPRCREIQLRLLAVAGKVIARYSYGIYLVHSTVIGIAFGLLGQEPTVVQWGTFIVGLALLSYLAFHLIEQPGIVLGRRLARRLTPLPVELAPHISK